MGCGLGHGVLVLRSLWLATVKLFYIVWHCNYKDGPGRGSNLAMQLRVRVQEDEKMRQRER